jgi:hypothetical protein
LGLLLLLPLSVSILWQSIPPNRPLECSPLGSSFRDFFSLRSSSASFPVWSLSIPNSTYLRFFPSSRHPRWRPLTYEGSQVLVMFRPQAFSASRRFTPPSVLQTYFVLLPRTGLFSVQGFLSSCSLCSLSRAVTPMLLVCLLLITRK